MVNQLETSQKAISQKLKTIAVIPIAHLVVHGVIPLIPAKDGNIVMYQCVRMVSKRWEYCDVPVCEDGK